MVFEDQMAWIDYQIEEIHKIRKFNGRDYAKSDLGARSKSNLSRLFKS